MVSTTSRRSTARSTGSLASFTAPASPDQVRSYFVDQFKKQGADVSLSGNSVTGKSKDGSPFTIDVSPSGSGSQGTIKVQDNDKD